MLKMTSASWDLSGFLEEVCWWDKQKWYCDKRTWCSCWVRLHDDLWFGWIWWYYSSFCWKLVMIWKQWHNHLWFSWFWTVILRLRHQPSQLGCIRRTCYCSLAIWSLVEELFVFGCSKQMRNSPGALIVMRLMSCKLWALDHCNQKSQNPVIWGEYTLNIQLNILIWFQLLPTRARAIWLLVPGWIGFVVEQCGVPYYWW